MKLTRSESKYYLQEAFKKESRRDLVMSAVDSLNKRVEIVKLQGIFTSLDTEVMMITDGELYWILKWLDNIAIPQFRLDKNKFNIELNDNFTDREISDFQLMNVSLEDKPRDTIVLDNVKKLNETEFFIDKLSYKKIVEALKWGITTYNYEVQRCPQIIRAGRELFKKPQIFRNAISNMKDKILNNEFFANTITWNMLDNGEQLLEWREYDWSIDNNLDIGQLIITKTAESVCNIIDGYNRTMAIESALADNPDLEGYMQLRVLMVDVPTALGFIEQESSGTPISAEKRCIAKNILQKNTSDYINNQGTRKTNQLKNQLGTSAEVKEFGKITSHFVMIDSISDHFKLKNNRDARKLADDLVKFYNELIPILELDFNNPRHSRLNRVTTYENMFYLYNYLASRLIGTENWENRLEKIIEHIDLNKENEFWSRYNITANISHSKIRNAMKKRLYNLGASLFREETEVATCTI